MKQGTRQLTAEELSPGTDQESLGEVLKVRPVDDLSEFGQNATVGTDFQVDTGGIDEVIAIIRLLSEAVGEDGKVAVPLPDGRKLHGAAAQGVTRQKAVCV